MAIVDALHRSVWQGLPYRWRRAALLNVAAIVAPRPSAGARAAAPIVVAGVLRTSSGLGQSARLCHDALKDTGATVYGVDLAATFRQPLDYREFEFADGRRLEGAGTVILHVNAPFVPLAMLRLGRRFVRNKRIIAYWAWELPRVPVEWRHGVSFVHDIWVPSDFTAKAVRSLAPDHGLAVIPHPSAIGCHPRTAAPRDDNRPFTVLTIFNMASGFARKNPCAAIRAFRQAFGDDRSVRLLVKYANEDAFREGVASLRIESAAAENIVLIGGTLRPPELAALYDQADVLLSLHRSEGFGLTLAEAMLRQIPVIATNWSGNTDFLTSETGIPIGYRLVPAQDPQQTYNHPDMVWGGSRCA